MEADKPASFIVALALWHAWGFPEVVGEDLEPADSNVHAITSARNLSLADPLQQP
jgi:hypothetical protein